VIGNGLGIASKLAQNSQERNAALSKSQTEASIAKSYEEAEYLKRREPLTEAVEAGYLTEEQAIAFGQDEQDSLDALNQASRQGMNASIRNALERSVRFQFKAASDPASAKAIAEAYGIGSTNIGVDTLVSLETLERQRLEDDAKVVADLMKQEGYTEHLGKSAEEVLEIWIDHPAAVREKQIRQSERRLKQEETSIAERAPAAARGLSAHLSKVVGQLNQVEGAYMQSNNSPNAGSNGVKLSLAEHLDLWAEDTIASLPRIYDDFPIAKQTFVDGVRKLVAQRVQARKDGLSTGTAEYNAQVLRPMEAESLRQRIEQDAWSISQHPVRQLQAQVSLASHIEEERVKWANLRDKAANPNPAESTVFLNQYLQDPATVEIMALFAVDAVENSSVMLNTLLNPVEGNLQQSLNDSIMTLQGVIRTGGIAANEAKVKNIVNAMSMAYQYNAGDIGDEIEPSPSKARLMEKMIVKHLSSDPRFIEMSEKSGAVRKLVRPYTAGIKQEIIATLQAQIEPAVRERVNSFGNPDLPGSRETPLLLWRKMGQYLTLDPKATNSTGIPQYKLVDGIEEALSPEDITDQQLELNDFNASLVGRTDPSKYELLKFLSGAKDIATALQWVMESADGVSMETFSPARSIPKREASAVEEQTEMTREEALEGLRETLPGLREEQ
jgi:hypothetical protein